MNKSLYYVECTCTKDAKYPNVEFHTGEVFYYNPKVSSNEMYLYYSYKDKKLLNDDELKETRKVWGWGNSRIPLTRKREYAKKWKVKSAAEYAVNYMNARGFIAVLKEIKITYTVEE